MKNVLIVISDMESGGGQKSLLSFLKCFSSSKWAEEYRIDVMVVKPAGLFWEQIVETAHVIAAPKALKWLGTPLRDKRLKGNFSVRGAVGKLRWAMAKRGIGVLPGLNDEQKLWECYKGLIPTNPVKYDTAVSYLNGFPNYYVMDKVNADKKVLWIHNEYQKLNYNADYDRPYYEACSRIITISQTCKDSFTEVFGYLADKIEVLENITVKSDILARAGEGKAEEYEGAKGLKLLSVGRLEEQKGFELAIDAAEYLKERGIPFLWLILGEGTKRAELQAQIDKSRLSDSVRLCGIRENPYVYINACDIFVQTSRYEGKSIVLDEAKIFAKPIVATAYPTVKDSLDDSTGMIVPIDGQKIGEGIEQLCLDRERQEQLTRNLKTQENGNERELSRYIELML